MTKKMEDKLTDTDNNEIEETEDTIIDVDKIKEEQNIQRVKQAQAKRNREPVKVTDILSVPKELRYSEAAVYKVTNLNEATETFVNGEQAESLKKYTDDYVIKFDHIYL